ncbi:hypothetical protein N7447_001565 [Penicillium robsamsonii]|uniref:uncharacterized protein n=1 Tax=Penicillium robsamsonii TaxID=1792511 RepID=UPI0025490446|nr:uncharacterized protein N7447_001565 [Penicillium robsamsonii]KAJ5835539.1 hypothetical protein N7447_001565 [Penicillium robsamsonii]
MSDESVIFTTHRALALPEIVCEILRWIDKDNAIWHRTRRLLSCALVNKTWCHDAIRILWRNMEVDGEPLNDVMIKISPDRRQTYANLIKSATITTYSRETELMVQPALENVVFPQLHTLRLVLVFYDLDIEGSIRIPTLNMPNLQTLHVGRPAGPIFLYPDQWDNLTDRILKLFPCLLNVRIEIPTILYIAGFEALSENLPNLKSIEFEDILSLSDTESSVEDTSEDSTDYDDTDDEDLDDESTE